MNRTAVVVLVAILMHSEAGTSQTRTPGISSTNSEAANFSPAAAAELAYATPASPELDDLIKRGQASKCAIITSPAGAEVSIDGNRAGLTPLVFVLQKHGDTPRTVSVRLSGYTTVEEKISPDGSVVPLALTLERHDKVIAGTLVIAPLSYGARSVDMELTSAIVKACPSVIHVNEYSSHSELRLTWTVKPRLAFSNITAALYRVSDGGLDHVFESHSVSALARELCSYVARR